VSTAQRIAALERRQGQTERTLDAAIAGELRKMTPEQEAAFLADFAAEFGLLLDTLTPETQQQMAREYESAGYGVR
jgi:hypothetical protein